MQGKKQIGNYAHRASYRRRHSPPCSNHKPCNDCRRHRCRELQEYSPKHFKHIIGVPDPHDDRVAEAVFYDGVVKTQIYG